MTIPLPRVLVIDDLFGRTLPDRRNFERVSLCRKFRLKDITTNEEGRKDLRQTSDPIAEAVFLRGQQPQCSTIGDTVENDLEGTLNVIRSGWTQPEPNNPRWAMVLLDLCFYTGKVTEESNSSALGMPEGRPGDDDPSHYFGLRILEAIHDEFPDLPVIILSSKPRDEVSRQFSATGAFGFLARSDAKTTSEEMQQYLWRHGLIEDESGNVVGRSQALLLALRAARRAAQSEGNVLLRGERGVGKELLARYLHNQRPAYQQNSPFVTVNSAVLTVQLYASELFGVEKRVATDVAAREGLIKEADGGDLFFDEIKDMVAEAQAGILRVLEEGTIMPLGAREAQAVNVQFLSATNADIETMAAAGKFRPDLLDRLRSGGTVILPPLRDRIEDIPALVQKFVRDAEKASNAMRRHIDAEALDKLCDCDWPGNIRQLRNCIFHAVRNNPDVEHLVPVHIDISDATIAPAVPTVEQVQDDEIAVAPVRSVSQDRQDSQFGSDIDAIIAAIGSVEFDATESEKLAGRLSDLQSGTARLLANYLRAALVATSRPTPSEPKGEIKIHPAVKLITGNSEISASQAADVIKRLLNLASKSSDLVKTDPVLAAAYETARRLRPSYSKKKQQKTTA